MENLIIQILLSIRLELSLCSTMTVERILSYEFEVSLMLEPVFKHYLIFYGWLLLANSFSIF